MSIIERGFSEDLKGRQFNPPFYIKNPVLQTVLSSLKFKNRCIEEFDNVSEEIIINSVENIRLSGHYSENPAADKAAERDNLSDNNKTEGGFCKNKAIKNKLSSDGIEKILILLHGWEGSEQSAYMVAAGRFFYRQGFSVLRLNMRDHGNSHHLNKGLFYGTLIDEAFGAVKKTACTIGQGKDIYIAGFSMGGNFALRMAALAGKDTVLKSRIKKVFAVNPPLNPWTATANIDRYFIIKKYFLKKWKRSLLKKESIFPGLYNFSMLPEYNSCIKLTDILIEKYSDYRGLEDYFSRYTLRKEFFKGNRGSCFYNYC